MIRRAKVDDATYIIAGIESICAENIYTVTERFLIDDQWKAVLYQPETVPDHLLAVADRNGEPIAFGNLFPGPEGRKDRHVATLGLSVLRSFRKRGIGTQLMKWMLNWATNTNLQKISLTVLANNKQAIHLYQKFNFETEGVYRRQYRFGNEYVDAFLMAKFLSDTR